MSARRRLWPLATSDAPPHRLSPSSVRLLQHLRQGPIGFPVLPPDGRWPSRRPAPPPHPKKKGSAMRFLLISPLLRSGSSPRSLEAIGSDPIDAAAWGCP